MKSTLDPEWNTSQKRPQLGSDEVHLWRAALDIPSEDCARIRAVLSSDEKARADRFRFDRDRCRFVVARGFLRAILSLYLDCAPHQVHFSYSEYGRPSLGGSHADFQLNFNLAHSGSLVLYGITRRQAIGVDLELIRFDFELEQVARRFFSPEEAGCLLSLPADARRKAFFDCWTRKEAFIKAKGMGFSLLLDQFDVSLLPGEPAALLETKWDKTESSYWSLRGIDVHPDYAAAVAVYGHEWQPRYWQVSNDLRISVPPR
jgi:4'-phosphopantetheinyl transferase